VKQDTRETGGDSKQDTTETGGDSNKALVDEATSSQTPPKTSPTQLLTEVRGGSQRKKWGHAWSEFRQSKDFVQECATGLHPAEQTALTDNGYAHQLNKSHTKPLAVFLSKAETDILLAKNQRTEAVRPQQLARDEKQC
jgi:hypothetical protein